MKFNLSNIKKFKKEHKFLFTALLISWVLGLLLFIPSIISLIKYNDAVNSDDYLRTLIFLISPISISIISFVTCKVMIKHPKIAKWISAILNIFFIWQLLSIILMGMILILGLILGALFIEPN